MGRYHLGGWCSSPFSHWKLEVLTLNIIASLRIDKGSYGPQLDTQGSYLGKLQSNPWVWFKPVKVPVQQRYCKLCNLGAVEDEDHFLLVCPANQSVWERFRGSLPLSAITPLAELLSCPQQGILARFLVQCQTVRSALLHQT